MEHIIRIILDETHSEFAPNLNREVGAVLARRLHSEYNRPVTGLRWYKPLNIHSNTTPVVGEYVLLIEGPSASFGLGKKLTDMYLSRSRWLMTKGEHCADMFIRKSYADH